MRKLIKIFFLIVSVVVVGGFIAGYTPNTDPLAIKAKYTNPASQFLKLDKDLIVHVRDEGKRDGSVLVMVHGSNASLQSWEPWVKKLGTDYRLISLDLPGHGLTGPHPGGVYTYESYVDVVDRVVERLGIKQMVLIGHSMGGAVGWRYALKHPQKIDGLVLIDAAGAAEPKERKLPMGIRMSQVPILKNIVEIVSPRYVYESSIKDSMGNKAAVDGAMVDRYWELNRYPGNREATTRRLSEASFYVDATKEQLASIKAPGLIMWGEDDPVFPAASATWFSEALPKSTLILYPAIGHTPMEEAPDKTATDVKKWLGQLNR